METNRELHSKITALRDVDLGRFTVDRFYLKKSTLTRGGPIYEDLAGFAL
jgi:2'-5' RNA ligase